MELDIRNAYDNYELYDKKKLLSILNDLIDNLENGSLRIAEFKDGKIKVNEWIKLGILLKFKSSNNAIIEGFSDCSWFDKVNLKFKNWNQDMFENSKIRAVPGCIVREGCYIAKSVTLMPCFVNIGAYIDSGTMIDSWVTVGSCAQIGKNCHISEGVGIGGVLEPIQANPVIIGDNCFIGAGCKIVEGVIIEDNCIIGMGVNLSASVKIINRDKGEIVYGRIPTGSVVVPGSIKTKNDINLNAAIIIKKIDNQSLTKTEINNILREV